MGCIENRRGAFRSRNITARARSLRSGALGSTYVVARRDVELGLPDMVGDMAHISQLETDIGPIVLWAEKELADGDIVRIFE